MFVDISQFSAFFKDKTIHLDNSKNWFEINFLGISYPDGHNILDLTAPTTNNENLEGIFTDEDIIAHIWTITPDNDILQS